MHRKVTYLKSANSALAVEMLFRNRRVEQFILDPPDRESDILNVLCQYRPSPISANLHLRPLGLPRMRGVQSMRPTSQVRPRTFCSSSRNSGGAQKWALLQPAPRFRAGTSGSLVASLSGTFAFQCEQVATN